MDNKTSNDSEITVRCGDASPSEQPCCQGSENTSSCPVNSCPVGSCPVDSCPPGDQHNANPLLTMLSAMGFPNFGSRSMGDRDGCSRTGRTVSFREDEHEDTDSENTQSTSSSHQDRLDDAWQLVSTLVESHRKICNTVSSLVKDLLDEDGSEPEDNEVEDNDRETDDDEEREPKRQDSVEIVDNRTVRRRKNRRARSSEEESD